MKRFINFLILLNCFSTTSQEFNPKTISLSENPTIEDFSFLKEELKDVQIVMLGESSHFDGNVFEMKTKIIKFLYQEMGFKTIAFESGIYDLWKAQKDINNGINTKDVLTNSLFSIWAKRNEFITFMDFYDENKKNLKLIGFDYQITGTNGNINLTKDIFEYAKKIKYQLKFKHEDFELLLESITNSGMFDEEDITFNQFKSELSDFKTNISKQKDSDEKFYYYQIVKSILELGTDSNAKEEILSTFYTTASDNNRDKQMADNLLAYIKQNPNEKIICWGANAHFVNNTSSIKEPIVKEFIPMGSYLKKELKSKVYSLASITSKDSVFIQNKWHKTPVIKNSFEDFLMTENKMSHLFISSNQKQMNSIMLNRFFSPITFIESNLSELHDGYFYYKKATPSTLIESETENIATYKTNNKITNSKINEFNEVEEVDKLKNVLNEVIVYGKRSAYQIISKTIESLEKNYPDNSFNSIMKTNIKSKVADSIYLDFDFIAEQYDLGYVNHINRSTKKIKEIRWNIKKDFQTESLREYHGLIYNSPIKYAPFLKKGKFKKFVFRIEETKIYNYEEVYVITFSSPRKHSTFTRRIYLSDYSGYLYINKKDNAIVKIFENWSVTEFPQSFRDGYELKNTLSKFTSKEYVNESMETDFIKINDLYYISHSTSYLLGNIYNSTTKSMFETIVDSYWNNFNIDNPLPIKGNEEQHLFDKVKFNEAFWKN